VGGKYLCWDHMQQTLLLTLLQMYGTYHYHYTLKDYTVLKRQCISSARRVRSMPNARNPSANLLSSAPVFKSYLHCYVLRPSDLCCRKELKKFIKNIGTISKFLEQKAIPCWGPKNPRRQLKKKMNVPGQSGPQGLCTPVNNCSSLCNMCSEV